jgi:hypothetical protein
MTDDQAHTAEKDALSIVRRVEEDMAEQAVMSWRSAEQRRGLADHEALLVYADALTRWSERLRMALKGEDYRDRVIPPGEDMSDVRSASRRTAARLSKEPYDECPIPPGVPGDPS